jgi:hypothetical protein
MKSILQDAHNQMFPSRVREGAWPDAFLPELEAEELETVIAPGIRMNHSETFLAAPAVLEAEELESVIAPGMQFNYSETFLP